MLAAMIHAFVRVSQRLSAFFGEERREVDVVSVHVFGYGNSSLGLDPDR